MKVGLCGHIGPAFTLAVRTGRRNGPKDPPMAFALGSEEHAEGSAIALAPSAGVVAIGMS